MKPGLIVITAICISLCISCDEDEKTSVDTTCNLDIDTIDFTFGIDYNFPANYLIPGEQSDLDSLYLEEVRNDVGSPVQTLNYILEICHWVNQNFTFENAGGAMIGVNSVNELFDMRKFYGCHSASLIISSILRGLDFPAVMIETASVQWAYDYKHGRTDNFGGHVMTEIYLNGNWILLDNNCTYVEDYDQMNPFIHTMGSNPDDYFVFAKGIDFWDYSSRRENFTHAKMLNFSDNVYCFEELFNTITYTWNE